MSYKSEETLIRSEMKRVMEYMLEKSNVDLFVFGDKEEDMKKRNKMAKAAKRIHNYYSMKEDRI